MSFEKILLLFCIHVYVHVHVHVSAHKCQKKGIRSPGAGAMDVRLQPSVDAGNLALVDARTRSPPSH